MTWPVSDRASHKLAAVQRALGKRQDQGAERANAPGFGRREHAAVNAAQDQRDQQEYRQAFLRAACPPVIVASRFVFRASGVPTLSGK